MLTALDNIRQDVAQLFYSVKYRLVSSKNYYCIAINSNFMLYFCRSYEARNYNLSWLITQLEAIVKRKPSGSIAPDQGLELVSQILSELNKLAPDNIPPGQPQDIIVEPQYTLSCLYTLINALQKAKWDFIQNSSNMVLEATINKIINDADATIDQNKIVATQNFGEILFMIRNYIADCEKVRSSVGVLQKAPMNILIDTLKKAANDFQEATLAETLPYSYPDLFRQVLAWLDSGRDITQEDKDNNTTFFLREVATFVDPTEARNPAISCRFADGPIDVSIRELLNNCPRVISEAKQKKELGDSLKNENPPLDEKSKAEDEKSRNELGNRLKIVLRLQKTVPFSNETIFKIVKNNIIKGDTPGRFARRLLMGEIEEFLKNKGFKQFSIAYLCANLHQAKMLSLCNKFDLVSIPKGEKWTERYTWINIQPDVTHDAIFVSIASHLTLAPLGASGHTPPPEACTKMEISYKLVFTDNDKRSYFDPKIIFSGPNKKECRETFLRAIMQPSSAAASPENQGIAARSRTTSQASTNVVRPRASSSLSLSFRSAFATAASQTSSSAISSSAFMRPHSTPPGTQGSSAASAAASSATSGSAKTTPSPSKVALRLGNPNKGVPNSVAMPSSAMPNGIERHPLPWSGQGRPPFFPLMQGVDRPLRSQRAAAPGRSPQRTPPASPGPGLGSDGSPFKPYARPQPPAVNATSSSSIAPPKLNFDGI